jgi:hypothetical protein
MEKLWLNLFYKNDTRGKRSDDKICHQPTYCLVVPNLLPRQYIKLEKIHVKRKITQES